VTITVRYAEDMELTDIDPDRIFRIPRETFEQMIEAGLFHEDDRIQLLEGVLVQMSPQHDPHAVAIVRICTLLNLVVGRRAQVAPQVPLKATAYSRPEPDLALWPAGSTSIPDRALLVVEVADSTLRLDRRVKAPIYAAAAVPEYWIVNLQDERLERYTEPMAGGYGHVETFERGAGFRLVALPDVEIAVADVLG
jgi:Uma2 family endonuclease